jgi:hypothetical protein
MEALVPTSRRARGGCRSMHTLGSIEAGHLRMLDELGDSIHTFSQAVSDASRRTNKTWFSGWT